MNTPDFLHPDDPPFSSSYWDVNRNKSSGVPKTTDFKMGAKVQESQDPVKKDLDDDASWPRSFFPDMDDKSKPWRNENADFRKKENIDGLMADVNFLMKTGKKKDTFDQTKTSKSIGSNDKNKTRKNEETDLKKRANMDGLMADLDFVKNLKNQWPQNSNVLEKHMSPKSGQKHFKTKTSVHESSTCIPERDSILESSVLSESIESKIQPADINSSAILTQNLIEKICNPTETAETQNIKTVESIKIKENLLSGEMKLEPMNTEDKNWNEHIENLQKEKCKTVVEKVVISDIMSLTEIFTSSDKRADMKFLQLQAKITNQNRSIELINEYNKKINDKLSRFNEELEDNKHQFKLNSENIDRYENHFKKLTKEIKLKTKEIKEQHKNRALVQQENDELRSIMEQKDLIIHDLEYTNDFVQKDSSENLLVVQLQKEMKKLKIQNQILNDKLACERNSRTEIVKIKDDVAVRELNEAVANRNRIIKEVEVRLSEKELRISKQVKFIEYLKTLRV